MNTIPLYRPYLSLEEIELILSALDPSSSPHKKLAELQIKIKYGLVKPATTIKVKESVSESLGFPISSEISQQEIYDTLATKVLDGSITEVEKLQGAELEMKLFGFNSGMFD